MKWLTGCGVELQYLIQGFIYEQNFFNFTSAQRTLAVQTETIITDYNVPQVLRAEPQMIVGKLYHLAFTYPVIDGVGYLESSWETISLIFVQVTLSKYSLHETKLTDLFKVKAPKIKTVLDYFKDLRPTGCKKYNILYVYASPHPYSSTVKRRSAGGVTFATNTLPHV